MLYYSLLTIEFLITISALWVAKEILHHFDIEKLAARIRNAGLKFRKRKEDKLLDSLLTAELADQQHQFTASLPGMAESVATAKEALAALRLKIESERDSLAQDSEAELKRKCCELEEQFNASFLTEKNRISAEVDHMRHERMARSKEVFAVAPALDEFLIAAICKVSSMENHQKIINLRPTLRVALHHTLLQEKHQFVHFAETVFGIESAHPTVKDLVLKRNPATVKELCGVLCRPETSGKLKELIVDMLVAQLRSQMTGRGAEGLEVKLAAVIESLRAAGPDPRLIKELGDTPIIDIISALEPSDEHSLIRAVFAPFRGSISSLSELQSIAEFSEKSGIDFGGELVNWSKIDSGSLLVCRRLTNATDYANMVKEVIKRNQKDGLRDSIRQQPRKSVS